MRLGIALFALLAVSSVIAKTILSGLGHNFDLESWALFSDLIRNGKNVYAETYRNPYGPIWAYVCAGAGYVQARVFDSESLVGFHRLLALFLSLVDVAIAALLARRYSLAVGALFLLRVVRKLEAGALLREPSHELLHPHDAVGNEDGRREELQGRRGLAEW